MIKSAWTAVKAFLGGWRMYMAIAAVALAMLTGAYVKGRLDGSDICDARLLDAKVEYDAVRDKAVAEARKDRDALASYFAETDSRLTKEVINGRADLDRLRADVAAGKRRLLVAARCPAPAGASGDASGAGLDHGASPGLERAAEQDYFTLWPRLEWMEKQLLGAQEIIRKMGEKRGP